MSEPTPKRLTNREVELIIRALKANVKTAKQCSATIKAKLREEFELQLNTLYPIQNDPVFSEQFAILQACWEKCQQAVTDRCAQRNIPDRFRPRLEIGWEVGRLQLFKDLRAQMRKLAWAQIDANVQETLEAIERQSSNMQLQIIGAGNLTDAAREFMAKLPSIEQLMPPVKATEVYAILCGTRRDEDVFGLTGGYYKRHLPEYQPDAGVKDEGDK